MHQIFLRNLGFLFRTTAMFSAIFTASIAYGGIPVDESGLEVSDFFVGPHLSNGGTNLLHDVTVLPGTDQLCPGVSLNYSIENTFRTNNTWAWETIAVSEATEFEIDWKHSGDHQIGRSRAGAEISAGVTNQQLHIGSTRGPFLKQGLINVSLVQGDDIRVSVSGSTWDGSNFAKVSGSLELRPRVCESLGYAPTVSCDNAEASVKTIWPPNHKFVNVDANFGALSGTNNENEPSAPVVEIDSIFQDEAVLYGGKKKDGPDGIIVDNGTVKLKAERAGDDNGRVYHIGFTATVFSDTASFPDATCQGVVKVSVPKSQKKDGVAIDDGALYDSTLPY